VSFDSSADGVVMAPPVVRRLSVQQVSRYYGRTRALADCSVAFTQGEIVAVLGPNGAGKTTLLRLLATLERPSEGCISMDAIEDTFRWRNAARRHIGLVAHDSLVYADLTGRENLGFTARMYGVTTDNVASWLDRVGLTDAADRAVGTYSRGMRQRLSIARALLAEPDVVLFDEPLTGLDRGGQTFLWTLLRWLREQDRIAIVVTHRFEAPEGVFDRVVVLDRGRVRLDAPAQGSIGALYDRAVGARMRS
jgi:ABC-type multidrug transport system ATPase subunit